VQNSYLQQWYSKICPGCGTCFNRENDFGLIRSGRWASDTRKQMMEEIILSMAAFDRNCNPLLKEREA
jgi:hypothetical protein